MRLRAAAAIAAVLLTAVGCGSGQNDTAANPDAALKVGVSPVPHAQVLRYVADNLAKDKGLKIEVVEFTDYVQPNTALVDKSLDANYFQTIPFLDAFKAESGAQLEWVGPVHLEPLGIYSKKHKKLSELPEGAKVAVANDPANEARGLRLLQANGLIKIKEGAEKTATVGDVVENPKKLEIVVLEAAQLPRSLDDTAASVVNGNYAIDAGLKPAQDALVLEKAEGNPNANGLVTRAELKDDKRIKDLQELLTSQQVKDYIKDTFSGAVLAV
ncbi:MetQ/NlpA family ABC transporter substrate-binding protein [Saccharothrix obliqua]|uniref:MetQ/NlpA family ABC transporter substrate-binding protein n=1 Tax=Saccharothrix obliqua TaxID=2861747 RepID=UPI001C5DC407|nr:MetQ/NlpA family ABC transporter substrate-binding protein [Saccharothrix obliqua]MBW4719123.1 MetQ/NlpA family ABC transporter substrate-binding protein [Saccharothrix obliqua]